MAYVLRPEVGEKHPFGEPCSEKPEYAEYEAKYGRMTRVYHRDRGEPWDHVKPKDYASVEALVEELRGDRSWIEWLYLFRGGRAVKRFTMASWKGVIWATGLRGMHGV